MSIQTFPMLAQGTDEWHDARRGIVTASIIGQLISVGKRTAIDVDCPTCSATAGNECMSARTNAPIKTKHPERAQAARDGSQELILEPARNDAARAIILRLAGERMNGWTEETPMNAAMWRGVEDEPRARDLYNDRIAPVEEIGFMRRDDLGGPLGYSPDGLVGHDGLIEIKSRAPKSQIETILAGHPPIFNMPQLQCGLLVSGREWIDYISYAGGMHMWVHRVRPDDRWFDAIKATIRYAEAAIQETCRQYADLTEGLILTERITEQEITL